MEFEELENAWRSQGEGFRMRVDSSLLLNEVKRSKNYFSALVFWTDFRECLLAFLMAAFFTYFGITMKIVSLLITAATMIWIGAFIIGDRIRQKRRYRRELTTLHDTIASSLQEVRHQVWLLKNIFWWYLLPPAVGMAAFYGEVFYSTFQLMGASGLRAFLFQNAFGILLAPLVLWGIYLYNQAAVRNELMPRQRELEKLLASLSEQS